MSARTELIALLACCVPLNVARDMVDLHHAEVLATAPSRAKILREEMRNLRRIEREDTPQGALGTRTGLLRAALILDERAEDAEDAQRAAAVDAMGALPMPTGDRPRDLRPGADAARRMIERSPEDPHDGPLHSSYATPRDLPELPAQRDRGTGL